MGSTGGAMTAHAYMKREKRKEGVRWKCVEVGHHRSVGKTIEEWEEDGWSLHSYTAAGNPGAISHYLLFTRSE